MLSVNQLSLSRQGNTLLDNLSLQIETGKLYALIGHNGSGKSTLIKALSGEMVPSQGSVMLDNQPIHKLPAKMLARDVAYLPQRLPDAAAFTVAELVMLGRYPHQKWLQKPNEQDHRAVERALALTQTQCFSDRTVATLSGGERARVWLAMCLAQQTRYLLLDEPLAALDVVYQVEVIKLIRQLVDEQGLGVVIILHDINLAAQFCDEFIALKNGKLCHIGDVESTMSQEVLQRIFGIHLHLLSHPSNGHKVAVV